MRAVAGRSGFPLAASGLALLLLAGLLCARLAYDAPLVRARGLLHVDALSALTLLAVAAHGLVSLMQASSGTDGRLPAAHTGLRQAWRIAVEAGLVGASALMGHLGLAGALLLGAALLGQERTRWAAGACTALGLALIGVFGGEWRHGQPLAGAGLNSVSFVLLLLGALLAAGAARLPLRRAFVPHPLLFVGCLACLLRLFSMGPWNLGWLFAAMLLGAGLALWAAWESAAAPAGELANWQLLWTGGLALAGAGLGSGAGLTLAGYALLCGPVLRLGLADTPIGRLRWLLCAATPLCAPFVLAWMGVAAALSGGLSTLALLLWLAALLAAFGVAREQLDRGPAGEAGEAGGAGGAGEEGGAQSPVPLSRVAAVLSVALGLGAPLVVVGLLRPVVAQLQGGLTPFGAIELWSWAGLIALNAAQQPVATLPSLALAALMLILAALCLVLLRLRSLVARPHE